MIVVLGFSHLDHWLAVRWLRWVSRLCMEEGGDSSGMTLILFGTRRITETQWDQLRDLHYHSDCMFHVEPSRCRDEKESGYPASATHLFYRALEHCESKHAGEPVLWAEADTVAMRPGWAQGIAAEYADCDKPFLGVQARSGGAVHMAGVAVYPPDWRAHSPCLSDALKLPDIKHWGRGKSQAWDCGCAHDIVPKMAVSKTICQMWRPARISIGTLNGIPDTTCLFHQDKRHTLAPLLAVRLGIEIDQLG